jgi:hypothetical protein
MASNPAVLQEALTYNIDMGLTCLVSQVHLVFILYSQPEYWDHRTLGSERPDMHKKLSGTEQTLFLLRGLHTTELTKSYIHTYVKSILWREPGHYPMNYISPEVIDR